MGVVKNVSADTWPRQGSDLGKRARVCFNYNTAREVMGTIVRDDMEAPFVTIISLDDKRVVLATECQYSPVD
jgi:hypothetical protein